MLESVLFPAPFSPSNAWTSPSAASKSTWSLASTPAKRLVTPRQAIAAVAAGTASAPVIDPPTRTGGGACAPPPRSHLEDRATDRSLALGTSDHALHQPVDGVEILHR